MSRSIHATRRQLAELKRSDWLDAEQKQQRIAVLREALYAKRVVKSRVWRERRRAAPSEAAADVESIPIEVREHGGHVHYPASVEDMRAVMRSLPRGTLDGLERIELGLGAEYQREHHEDEEGYGEPDPLVGRLGVEMWPGVYSGEVLGTYFLGGDATIRVYAYVYDAANMPDRDVREAYLRLCMLETLLHEIGHHWDGTACDPRGRWVNQPEGKRELSAKRWAYQWTLRHAIPYLEQAYPAETQALIEWLARHGGARLKLSKLVNHPDEWVFYTGGALEELFRMVDDGESARDICLNFARDLHYAERFEEALESLATLLGERPDDVQARTLQANIYEHQGHYEQAERIARDVVGEDPACDDAWDVLVDVYRAQGRWPELEAAATRVAETPGPALHDRACARIELGDFAGAAADIEASTRGGRIAESPAVRSLRALLLLRTGEYAEALRIAREWLRGRRHGWVQWRGVLEAVRFEAAMRLGKRHEAGTISKQAVTLLRRHGHGAWVDRLVREYGLRVWKKHGL